ncbi:MAG: hypothetical protein RR295_03160, partial [Oscillospiraceae bacterium]
MVEQGYNRRYSCCKHNFSSFQFPFIFGVMLFISLGVHPSKILSCKAVFPLTRRRYSRLQRVYSAFLSAGFAGAVGLSAGFAGAVGLSAGFAGAVGLSAGFAGAVGLS